MKQAVILQAWYQAPDSNWYPWLKKELEKKGYTVFLPDLPTMHIDLPDMQQQLKFLKENVQITPETIIFGHSLGCLLALRLAETQRFYKLFLVAGWDFDDLTPGHKLFWQNKLNHQKIKEHVKEIYCISSDNDPFMTSFTVEEMSKRLEGKFVLIKGAGHFIKESGITKIPKLLNFI